MRIFDEDYYPAAELSFLIRTGKIVQPSPIHSNPADYGQDRKFAINCRLRYLKSEKKLIQSRLDSANQRLLHTMSNFDASCAIEHRAEFDKLEREIKYQLSLLRGSPERLSYDIAVIKRIPMDQLTRINANGFFQDNPFRKEKSPSNSLHWDKKTNRYKDFGSDEHGDNIDLYMALHKCDLKTALKELNNL